MHSPLLFRYITKSERVWLESFRSNECPRLSIKGHIFWRIISLTGYNLIAYKMRSSSFEEEFTIQELKSLEKTGKNYAPGKILEAR
jgi:hypothetical protein